ncbi:VOC family protein [Streptomyces sp900116325]|uniref:VOC family protein n=1 Tax=Streptomyces sp. 900116325 TaxID=3154295 RepID=A0ABV2ULU1_9ACTN
MHQRSARGSCGAMTDITNERPWPGGITAITLFTEDLEATKEFYREVFDLPVDFENANSAVLRFGDTLINLLKSTEAPGLIDPRQLEFPTPAPGSNSL